MADYVKYFRYFPAMESHSQVSTVLISNEENWNVSSNPIWRQGMR